jgi:hypothetical protein
MKVLPVSCLVWLLCPPIFTTDDERKPWPRMPTWVPTSSQALASPTK